MAERKKRAFTPEEQEAMRERARERRAAAKDPEGDMAAKIKAMPQPDREMAERLAAAIKAGVPELSPRTWYGMPAWTKDDKVVCFFQNASKFRPGTRRSASATRRSWTTATCGPARTR